MEFISRRTLFRGGHKWRIAMEMSGLSETERGGCTSILKLMSKSDILSLSDTVTNKMIVVENLSGMIFKFYDMAGRWPRHG